jgi:hypothetical protein
VPEIYYLRRLTAYEIGGYFKVVSIGLDDLSGSHEVFLEINNVMNPSPTLTLHQIYPNLSLERYDDVFYSGGNVFFGRDHAKWS